MVELTWKDIAAYYKNILKCYDYLQHRSAGYGSLRKANTKQFLIVRMELVYIKMIL